MLHLFMFKNNYVGSSWDKYNFFQFIMEKCVLLNIKVFCRLIDFIAISWISAYHIPHFMFLSLISLI